MLSLAQEGQFGRFLSQAVAVPPSFSAAHYTRSLDQYAERGANLSGAADSGQLIFSAWVKVDVGTSGTKIILGNSAHPTFRFLVYVDVGGFLYILGRNAAGTVVLDMVANGININPGTNFYHVMWSLDLSNASKRHAVVDGVERVLGVNTYTLGEVIDFTTGQFYVAQSASSGEGWNGCLQHVFLHFGSGAYLNLSDPSVVQRFRTVTGHPADLGSQGELGLGFPPLLYAPTGDPTVNVGTGGNFSLVNGPLTACDSTP